MREGCIPSLATHYRSRFASWFLPIYAGLLPFPTSDFWFNSCFYFGRVWLIKFKGGATLPNDSDALRHFSGRSSLRWNFTLRCANCSRTDMIGRISNFSRGFPKQKLNPFVYIHAMSWGAAKLWCNPLHSLKSQRNGANDYGISFTIAKINLFPIFLEYKITDTSRGQKVSFYLPFIFNSGNF